MPFSVYIARPPAGGGYDPDIYKVGKSTEADVTSRVDALNDAGSNYPTANGENWELVDHFEFASQEQMDAFESAMAANLDTGVDPLGTGATELFESAALDTDVHDAALAAVGTLVEDGLIDVETVAELAVEHGVGGAAERLRAATGDLPEEAVEETADMVLELLSIGVPVLGIALLLWRGIRIYGWIMGEWGRASDQARSAAPPRPSEPPEVAKARRELDLARRAMDSKRQRQ
ncbi:MAG: hypothetical protein OXQ28_14780 [Acidobacteriota bacterium]|nr:hypothetical protein [Acidobacteriota bacterium]